MERVTHMEWQFGGWLANWPTAVQWSVLAALFLMAVAATFLSYRSTRLSFWRLMILLSLRIFFLLGLVICLANPRRLERLANELSGHILSVVVDRSESMIITDSRGRSRLDDACRKWMLLREKTEKRFDSVRFGSFAGKYLPSQSWEDALKAKSEDKTHLYGALLEVLDATPLSGQREIVCLTDGLDTTSMATDGLVARALATHTPLWFVVGENRQRTKDFLQFREFKVPSQVLRKTTFTCIGVLEAFSAHPRQISISLWQDGRKLHDFSIELPAGPTLIPLRETISAVDPGEMVLEWRVGNQNEAEVRHEVRIIDRSNLDILYYQGALDWGFRSMHTLLMRDPSYHFTAILNPRLGVNLQLKTNARKTSDGLPESVAELKKFQVVIVENLFANQLSTAQQEALRAYAEEGGALFFIIPNKEATAALENTKIAEMLPVVFESPGTENAATAKSRGIQNLHPSGSLNAGSPSTITLQPFAFPEESSLAPLLKTTDATGTPKRLTPKFATYAPIQRSKSGAEILGLHPNDREPTSNKPRILLAAQRYGKGRIAVMATDSLWRWKLSEPSDSRDVEIFWQQWIFWLAQSSVKILQFIDPPIRTIVNQTSMLTVNALVAPTLTATDPNGKALDLPAEHEPKTGYWKAAWKPECAGHWQITASDPEGRQARIFVNVDSQLTQSADLANLPSQVERLRELGEATGGGLLEHKLPEAWGAANMEKDLFPEKSFALWNSWNILLACLALYSAELLLRRRWQMI